MTWNKDFFNLAYQELFMNRSQKEIDFQVKIINKLSNINNPVHIVDFCCGIGDLLHKFQEQGNTVYGVDFSKDYIEKSKKVFCLNNVYEGDALTFKFDRKFDLALNWYSSFGYFSEENNQLLLKNIYEHLLPDGIFILEVFNSYNIIRNYSPVFNYLKTYNNKKIDIIRESSIDFTTRILNQKWTFKNDENHESYCYNTESHLYFLDEIIDKMKQVGFKNVQCFETPEVDITFKKPNLDSKRLIFIGQK